MNLNFRRLRNSLFFAILAHSLTYMFTANWQISLAIATMVLVLKQFSARRKESRFEMQILEVIPEIIDHVISGVQSGMSLNDSLIALQHRGPNLTQKYFATFSRDISGGLSFEKSITNLQHKFANRNADQLFEALQFALKLGGNELLTLLRQLGDFSRQDLTQRNEINSRQESIRNSAHLSASAPWLLLLLLSNQKTTQQAFSNFLGFTILFSGVIFTIIAYFWMDILSRMPKPKRVFGLK